MIVRVTPQLKNLASDLHRRRVLANQTGHDLNLQTTIAEVTALAAFDKEPMMSDLKQSAKSLQFVPTDDSDREVRIIYRHAWPLRVYSYRLDRADAFLFVVKVSDDELDVVGWLPQYLVERAPVYWFEENGVRVDYAHEIERGNFFDLPDKFDFTDDCGFGPDAHRDETFNGLWDHGTQSWECFGCGKYLYDESTRSAISTRSSTAVPS